jgi:hypothetical protein
MAKIRIEIEFPEFVTAMMNDCEFTPEQSVKVLRAFVEGTLSLEEGFYLENDLSSFIDNITDSGELDEIIGE